MTSTSPGPSLTAPPTRTADHWNRRLVALLVALIWPTQLLAVAGIVTANTTADIAQRFHTTQVAWFSLIVTMVSTLLIPFVIKAGDRYGRRRIMLAMIGLGVVGDIVAATAGSFWLLLVGRGIAACYAPFAALSFPAVRDLFPARTVKQASAILGGSMGLVGVVGPLLAGWLIDAGGYRAALWFIAGATAVAFVLVALLVPETPRHDFQNGFDWPGGILLGGGLSAVVYAVGQGGSRGWTSGATLGWTAGGLVALVAFVLVQRSSAHPILDLRVLGRRPVALTVSAAAVGQATALAMASMGILLALYPRIPGVSDGLGWTSTHNARVGLTWNLVMLGTGFLAGRLLRKADARLLWGIGLGLGAAGYGLMGLFHADATELVLTACLAHLGTGLIVSIAPVLVLGVVSVEEQGQGSGLMQMLFNFFGTVVPAVCFAVLAAHSTVLKGTAFYLDAGYTWVFWTGALILLAALAMSLFIPALRDPEESDPAPAA
ncbi:MFS family permease [Streptomyces sp. 3330]|uniref:MFS transporter n=1 Tax=Streptomyces sp. 3330 TaxID=2817755 RepID=UPI002860DD0B|nr:MFS transporter [Streptomyces sp. 3330]MDR6977780.1 MFS family permease [Streptomyces sp. 3330]